jgi:hypothetical protein
MNALADEPLSHVGGRDDITALHRSDPLDRLAAEVLARLQRL